MRSFYEHQAACRISSRDCVSALWRHFAQQPNPIFKGKKVLLVAATSSPTAPVDANIKKHFESLGMIVNMVADIDPPRGGWL